MAKLEKALKRKVNKMVSEVSSELQDAGEKFEEMEVSENDTYYPQVHFEGDELKGLEVGEEVQIFAVGKVSSKHESENYKGGGVEIHKILVVPKDSSDDDDDEE